MNSSFFPSCRQHSSCMTLTHTNGKLRNSPYKTKMGGCDLTLSLLKRALSYKTKLFAIMIVCFGFNLPINGQSECLVSVNLSTVKWGNFGKTAETVTYFPQ